MSFYMVCDECKKKLGVFDGWATDVEMRLCMKCARRMKVLPES